LEASCEYACLTHIQSEDNNKPENQRLALLTVTEQKKGYLWCRDSALEPATGAGVNAPDLPPARVNFHEAIAEMTSELLSPLLYNWDFV